MSDPRIHPESTDGTDEEVDVFHEAPAIDQHSGMDPQADPIAEVTPASASDDMQSAAGGQPAAIVADPEADSRGRKTRKTWKTRKSRKSQSAGI